MAGSAKPLIFNLALRADRDRFARLYHGRTGEGLSEVYWRLFDEVVSAGKLESDVLDWYRRRLVVVLDRLDAICLELGGPLKAFSHPSSALCMQDAQRIVEEARRAEEDAKKAEEDAKNAYALQLGQAMIRGRAAGGRAKDRPGWWDPTIEQYKILWGQGRSPRAIVGILSGHAVSEGHSATAIRRMLQNEGVLRRKTSAK